jgi:tRNA threonylcarbamoyladenosine biosynthesis protein TsaB
LLDGHKLLASFDLSPSERSAKALVPAIHALWREVGWQPADTELIALAIGPGSFTGLRVGVTTAKTLAYALRAAVLGVNTLEVIASQAPDFAGRITVWLDAQRNQLFSATFQAIAAAPLQPIEPAHIVDEGPALAALVPGQFITGPALKKMAAGLPAHVQPVASQHWQPTAAAIGQLALRKFEAGERGDLWRLTPLYLRQSAAEEKWDREGRP